VTRPLFSVVVLTRANRKSTRRSRLAFAPVEGSRGGASIGVRRRCRRGHKGVAVRGAGQVQRVAEAQTGIGLDRGNHRVSVLRINPHFIVVAATRYEHLEDPRVRIGFVRRSLPDYLRPVVCFRDVHVEHRLIES